MTKRGYLYYGINICIYDRVVLPIIKSQQLQHQLFCLIEIIYINMYHTMEWCAFRSKVPLYPHNEKPLKNAVCLKLLDVLYSTSDKILLISSLLNCDPVELLCKYSYYFYSFSCTTLCLQINLVCK